MTDDDRPHWNQGTLPADDDPRWELWEKRPRGVRMMRISGPCRFTTIEGTWTDLPADWRGWLAIDSEGHPYPLHEDVQRACYTKPDDRPDGFEAWWLTRYWPSGMSQREGCRAAYDAGARAERERYEALLISVRRPAASEMGPLAKAILDAGAVGDRARFYWLCAKFRQERGMKPFPEDAALLAGPCPGGWDA